MDLGGGGGGESELYVYVLYVYACTHRVDELESETLVLHDCLHKVLGYWAQLASALIAKRVRACSNKRSWACLYRAIVVPVVLFLVVVVVVVGVVVGVVAAAVVAVLEVSAALALETVHLAQPQISDSDQTKHLFFHQEVVVDTSEANVGSGDCLATLLQLPACT